jgi:hypothetical protein
LNHLLAFKFGWMSQKDEAKDSTSYMTCNCRDRWLLHVCQSLAIASFGIHLKTSTFSPRTSLQSAICDSRRQRGHGTCHLPACLPAAQNFPKAPIFSCITHLSLTFGSLSSSSLCSVSTITKFLRLPPRYIARDGAAHSRGAGRQYTQSRGSKDGSRNLVNVGGSSPRPQYPLTQLRLRQRLPDLAKSCSPALSPFRG